MWGVEIQATIAANLIEKNWVRRADFPLEAGALSTLAFCATFLLATVSIALASALVVAIAALWSIAVFYLFVAFNCSIPGATLFFVLLPLAVALRVLSYSLVKWREARRFRIQRAA